MKRSNFIRLGMATSAMTLTGALPCFCKNSTDSLDNWATNHRAVITSISGELHIVAKPLRSELSTALQELHDLSEGALRCSGNSVHGTISGKTFQLDLQAR